MLVEHFHNTHKSAGSYPERLQSILRLKDAEIAFNEISTWPSYEQTPLLSLNKIATEIGIKEIYYKDESSRFGLGSFKALGGTYGVLRFIKDALEDPSRLLLKV